MSHRTSHKPLVSIVIPVFNGGDYLRFAIESALSQTYQNIEILVVNDGSSDFGHTEQVALGYGQRIRYLYKQNGGVASALNVGIKNMQGELFCWLSHDDLYYPHKVESQVAAYLAAKDKRTIVFCDFELIDNDAKFLKAVSFDVNAERMVYHFLAESYFHGNIFMVPRHLFGQVGDFNESLRYTQDYDMWIRLSQKFKFIRVPKVLVQGRQHGMQDSKVKRGEILREGDDFFASQVLSFGKNNNAPIDIRLRQYWHLYRNHKLQGHYKTAQIGLNLFLKQIVNPVAWPWAIWLSSSRLLRGRA